MKYLSLFLILTGLCGNTIWGFETEEIRGIWLRPPDDPACIPRILNEIAESGFNNVFVETFYHGFTISASSPIPIRPEFSGQDILQRFIDEGHQRNLKIHAWLEAYYWEVDTEKYPQYPQSPLLHKNPDWVLKLKGNRETWETESAHRFANPAHPGVQKLLLDYIEDLLIRYPLDGIQLDYIRYPSGNEDAGYDNFTIEKFISEIGFDPSEISPKQSSEWKQWVEWRENQVTDLVRQVHYLKNKVRPDCLLSAAVFPGYYKERYQRYFKFQDYATWAREALLDLLVPMAYSNTLGGIRQEVEETLLASTGKVQVIPGLAIERNQKDEYSGVAHPPIRDQIVLTREMQLPGHAIFCYAWILDSPGGMQMFRDQVYQVQDQAQSFLESSPVHKIPK